MYNEALILRHAKIANILVRSSLNKIKAMKNRNRIASQREGYRAVLAGCLLIESSANLISQAVGSLKTAKRLSPKEYEDVLRKVEGPAVTALGSLITIIENRLDTKVEKKMSLGTFLQAFINVTSVMDNLYDLSESIMFQKDGKAYFALQDNDLHKWSKEIVDYFAKNKNLINSMKNSKDNKVKEVGFSTEKSFNRLNNHLQKNKAVADLRNDSQVIGRTASEDRKIIKISVA